MFAAVSRPSCWDEYGGEHPAAAAVAALTALVAMPSSHGEGRGSTSFPRLDPRRHRWRDGRITGA
jgi:hypothetical protein